MRKTSIDLRGLVTALVMSWWSALPHLWTTVFYWKLLLTKSPTLLLTDISSSFSVSSLKAEGKIYWWFMIASILVPLCWICGYYSKGATTTTILPATRFFLLVMAIKTASRRWHVGEMFGRMTAYRAAFCHFFPKMWINASHEKYRTFQSKLLIR